MSKLFITDLVDDPKGLVDNYLKVLDVHKSDCEKSGDYEQASVTAREFNR
jgi:hypothetical protein